MSSNNQSKQEIASSGQSKTSGEISKSNADGQLVVGGLPEANESAQNIDIGQNNPLSTENPSTKGKRQRTEYGQHKRRYKRAKYILLKVEESILNGEKQTDQQLKSIEWAENQIGLFESMKAERMRIKSEKQQDGLSDGRDSKRLKSSASCTIVSEKEQDRSDSLSDGGVRNRLKSSAQSIDNPASAENPLTKGNRTSTGYARQKREYIKAKYILKKSEESIRKGEEQTDQQIKSREWAKDEIRIFESMKAERIKILSEDRSDSKMSDGRGSKSLKTGATSSESPAHNQDQGVYLRKDAQSESMRAEQIKIQSEKQQDMNQSSTRYSLSDGGDRKISGASCPMVSSSESPNHRISQSIHHRSNKIHSEDFSQSPSKEKNNYNFQRPRHTDLYDRNKFSYPRNKFDDPMSSSRGDSNIHERRYNEQALTANQSLDILGDKDYRYSEHSNSRNYTDDRYQQRREQNFQSCSRPSNQQVLQESSYTWGGISSAPQRQHGRDPRRERPWSPIQGFDYHRYQNKVEETRYRNLESTTSLNISQTSVTNTLKLVLVDGDGNTVDKDTIKAIEYQSILKLAKQPKGGDKLTFKGNWEEGFRVYDCVNERSQYFLKMCLESMDLRGLRLVPYEHIRNMSHFKGWIWIQEPYLQSQTLLDILDVQNEELNVKATMKVIQEGKKQEGGQYFLLSMHRSLIQTLKNRDWKVNVGFFDSTIQPVLD